MLVKMPEPDDPTEEVLTALDRLLLLQGVQGGWF